MYFSTFQNLTNVESTYPPTLRPLGYHRRKTATKNKDRIIKSKETYIRLLEDSKTCQSRIFYRKTYSVNLINTLEAENENLKLHLKASVPTSTNNASQNLKGFPLHHSDVHQHNTPALTPT